ncbi:MAG: cysteine desulfurase family protein [Rhodospirillales bacterium]|nr:cysteine desulfurase family protein [Rhodospirillales bacterium]
MGPSPVYLDHLASTPLDPRVKAAMARHENLYGNPHTTSHLAGIEAARAVEAARRQVARAIGGDARRVVFTSGATEANNLALFGVARAASTRRRIITVRTEHSSVLEPVQALGQEGFEVEQLPVQADGLVDLDAVERAVDERTLLVSVMHVNNETGTIQPVPAIAAICRRVGAFLHSDCAQSLGRLSLDIRQHGADLLTLSAHKCYGPKGIGALYVGSRVRKHIKPITLGGGQEGGLRPGTLPVPLCIGFGEACRAAVVDVHGDAARMAGQAGELLDAIFKAFPDAQLNGSHRDRVPGAFNVCFPWGSGDELLNVFEGIQVSSGSACASTISEPSPVLMAHGLSPVEAGRSLRFCVGRFTTDKDIRIAGEVIRGAARRRVISPLSGCGLSARAG